MCDLFRTTGVHAARRDPGGERLPRRGHDLHPSGRLRARDPDAQRRPRRDRRLRHPRLRDDHRRSTARAAASATVDHRRRLPAGERRPEARGLDRLFEIHPTAGNVTFSDLTLREGFVDGDGAAIQNWSSGLLRLENVARAEGQPRHRSRRRHQQRRPGRLRRGCRPTRCRCRRPGASRSSTRSSPATARAAAARRSTTPRPAPSRSWTATITDNPGQMIPDPASAGSRPATGASRRIRRGSRRRASTSPRRARSPTRASSTTSARSGSPTRSCPATTRHHDGGGIANEGDGILIVENSTITDNTSEAAGGGIYSAGGT